MHLNILQFNEEKKNRELRVGKAECIYKGTKGNSGVGGGLNFWLDNVYLGPFLALSL